MRRLGGQVWQRARGGAADARASGVVDRPSRRSPESSEGRDARRTDLVAWPAGLDVAGRGLARGQTLRKSIWVMVRPGTEEPMITVDFITALFCQVADQMPGIPKHPHASLWPSEVVTLGLLHALKGVGNHPFYRWLTRDYRP